MKKLFVLFLCLFVGNSFASGIASNSASAPCTNNTLETYSGNSNLAADWQPNTINLTWYNEQEKLTVQQSAQSCTYDGTLTIPSTPPTRTGYTFAGWKVRIPGTYTELEYIQSTGTQWIDTNFIPDNNTRVKTKVQFDSAVNGQGTVFGSSLGYNNSGFECFRWGTHISFMWGTKAWYSEYSFDINDVAEIDWNKNVLNYKKNNENILQAIFNNQTFTTAYPLKLFSLSRGQYYDDVGHIKMYYAQIYDNGVLILDFIPARRNSDGVVGMYDAANQTFYTSPNGANFVAGPAVQ